MTQADNDVTTVVLEQHQDVARRLDAVQKTTGSSRAAEFQSLVELLGLHEHAEESVIYPVVRKLGDDGTRVADERTKEESAAEATLTKLKGMDARSESFETLFREFSTKVHAHADSEEREVLPLLKRSVSDHERQTMGDAFRRAVGLVSGR